MALLKVCVFLSLYYLFLPLQQYSALSEVNYTSGVGTGGDLGDKSPHLGLATMQILNRKRKKCNKKTVQQILQCENSDFFLVLRLN